MKLAQILFSTNRPEYLARTLAAQEKCLDTNGCGVDRFLFDDFPKGRDDAAITALGTRYGYEVMLHERNLSIGATWEEAWARVRQGQYDYVWQQEDDAEMLEPVKVNDLADILAAVPNASQVVLKRQAWYPHEVESAALPDDLIFPRLRGEFNGAKYYFSSIASFYPAARARIKYREWFKTYYPGDPIFHGANVNEGLIGKVLLEGYGLQSLHLKHFSGRNMIRHIGEYTVGQKVLPHEPGFALFAALDPEIRYDSRKAGVWAGG